MARTNVPTRTMTIYRLPSVKSTVEEMFDALDSDQLSEIGADLSFPETLGVPAVWVEGQFAPDTPAEWCAAATITTGRHVEYYDARSAGLLMLAVDGTVFAVGYGAGHRLIPDDHKDQRFGLSFAVRCVDPERIHDLVRRFPGARGRTDATIVPGGLPIWSLGVSEPIDIVRKAGGELRDVTLDLPGAESRGVRVEGGAGLRMPLAIPPRELVATVRTVNAVCRKPVDNPALKFIDNVQQIGDRRVTERLDDWLDDILGDPPAATQHVGPVVPTTCLHHFADARAIRIKIGSGPAKAYRHLALDPIVQRAYVQGAGARVAALRRGQIALYADERATERLQGAMALRWLEATTNQNGHRYFLMDGQWYEIGERYLDGLRGVIERVINPSPSEDLPAWDLEWDEGRYNRHVQDTRGIDKYLCLDKTAVQDRTFRRRGFEPCDLLGPENELVHVKRAKGSAPLSHLFYQALVSAQTIKHSPEANRRFAETVRQASKGRRTLPDGFIPEKVVLAILLKDGEQLTPDTLFPFSQVTLAYAANVFQTNDEIELEVIGIQADR